MIKDGSVRFGKKSEYFVISHMLLESLDCYLPIVDDDGIDVVVRKDDKFKMIQIKARSRHVKEGDAALFAALRHDQIRENYFFIFYSERMQKDIERPFYWILSSEEFFKESRTNKSGKNKGKKTICFNGYRKNSKTGQKEEYIKEQFKKYVYYDFSRIFE